MAKSEQSLLSCILKKGDLIKEVALTEQHFSKLEHQRIFTAMKSLDGKNQPIDIVSVLHEIGQDIVLIGGHSYLADLFNMITQEDNFKTYEKYIFDDFKVKEAKEITKQIQDIQSSKDIEKVKEYAQQLNNILDEGEKNNFDLLETLLEIDDDTNKDFEGVQGIPTGFHYLDTVTDGWIDEELIILAARPSVGKTAFALEITKQALFRNYAVDFFSLEMSDKSLLTRMLCSIGELDAYKMKNPKKRFSETDWKKYSSAQGVLSRMKDKLNIVDDSSVTVQKIRSKVKQSIKERPDKKHLIVIDYLTLIHGSGRKERNLEVGEISRNLKRMARDLSLPIIVLSQLSRALEQRKDKRPMLSDLRDSGEIEQDADKVIFLHRDDYYESEKTDDEEVPVEIIVAKNRNGSLGNVGLNFKKAMQKYENAKRPL
ncbi:replicative DNA helicase [Cytobacillus oceanisediminis]|uniref:replicative DNA helicase n=1 Tax=Cytobacillus oceanisediminis TaxID=665099 RepID=UPI0037353BF4